MKKATDATKKLAADKNARTNAEKSELIRFLSSFDLYGETLCRCLDYFGCNSTREITAEQLRLYVGLFCPDKAARIPKAAARPAQSAKPHGKRQNADGDKK